MELRTIEGVLEEMGWESQPHGEQTLCVKRTVREDELHLYIRVESAWVTMAIVPFLSTGNNNSFELARWLLRMNRDMPQLKFAYDEDGDVLLEVELPAEELSPIALENALQMLLKCATAHRMTLRFAAAEPV